MNKAMIIFKSIVILIISIIMLIFPKEILESTVESINNCINIIIPSMFSFMVISTYIISSGLYDFIFNPIYIITKRIIKLDKCLFSIFCLSLIGGYPVGIKLLKEVIAQNKNYSEICSTLSAFCYCISPTFSITMIGIGLFNNAEAGLIIYISNLLACVIIAIFQSNRYNLKINNIKLNQKGGIVYSVNSSANVLLKICSTIVIFNVIITVIEDLFSLINVELSIFLKSILEISNVVYLPDTNIFILPIISAIASMGGICVLFQSFSLIGTDFPTSKFLLSRIPCAALSFLITKLLLLFWNISIPAVTENKKYIFELNTNRVILVLLLIMCIILLQKNEKILKKG